MISNIGPKTSRRERRLIRKTVGLMAVILTIGGISGCAETKEVNTPDSAAQPDRSEKVVMTGTLPMARLLSFTPTDPVMDTTEKENLSEEETIEREISNAEALSDNADRSISDIRDEAEAVAQLNQTDNKDWDGTVELWVDGIGWVPSSELTPEQMAEVIPDISKNNEAIGQVTGTPTNPTVSQGNGHYEERWIVDSPAHDEPEYRTGSYYVCNGCGKDLGSSEESLDAHGREAMLSGNFSCGSWKTLYRAEETGNVIHHEEVGHYEKVWVEG